MKDQENLNKLQELIEKFDFEELSKKDKEFVLSNSSQDEYEELRSIVEKSKSFFENQNSIKPDDKILNKLHYELEEKSWISSIINYQIPLYKLAVSVIILFGILFIFINHQYSREQIQIAQVDTVYIENFDTVKITEYDTVEIIKKVFVKKENNNLRVHPIITNLNKTQFSADYSVTLKTRSVNPKDLDRLLKYTKSNSIKYDKNLATYVVNKL